MAKTESPRRMLQNKKPIKRKDNQIPQPKQIEKSVTSVKVKQEKLDQAQASKKIVSPDPKQSKIQSHYPPTTIQNVEYVKDNVMKINSLEDAIMSEPNESEDKKLQINQKNVFAFIQNTTIESLYKLEHREILNVITMWKKLNKESIRGLKTRSYKVLQLDMDDIKEAVRSQAWQKELSKIIETNVKKQKESVEAMEFTSETSIEDIKKYQHQDLCLFLYHKSGIMDKAVKFNDLKSKHEDEILAKMIQYVQTLKIPKQPQETFKLNSSMTEKDINEMDLETLKKTYHQYTIESGTYEIPYSTIDMWTKPVLDDLLKSKLQIIKNAQPKKSIPIKEISKPASTLKKNSKYGKKMVQTQLLNKNKTLNTCRYSVAFTIPDKFKGTDGLRSYLLDVFTEMVSYGDEQFCILPWDTDAITKRISDPDDLPTKITEIKKYFNGARPPESSSYIYTKIRLGFSLGFDRTNFDADIQGYCKNKSIRFYECSVQHPNVRSCGWLAYVPRTLNQTKWCQAITQLYNTVYQDRSQQQFQIGLTWRVLNGQKDVDKKNKLRAMHVDAPVEIATRVKRFLRALSSKKRWILGIKFRMIDEFHQYMRPDMKQKYRYMVSKHRAMMNQIGICDCTQIINLDSKIGTSEMTVRDLVVNIRDNTDNFRIFASIDEKWNSDTTFSAAYRPDKASKAYDYMRSLSTYVAYLYPQASLKRIFTFDAIEKSKSEKYDPKTQTFTTQDDLDLYKEIQADLDDDSLEYLKVDDIENPFEFDETINLVGGDSVWDFTGDNETVSTGAGTKITFDKAKMKYYDTRSCASSISTSSNTSLNSQKEKKKVEVPDPIQEEIQKLDIAAAKEHKGKVHDAAEVA